MIQTKWLSTWTKAANYLCPIEVPMKLLRKSLERLGLDYVDIYLVHGHIHPQSIASAAEGMAKCDKLVLTRSV